MRTRFINSFTQIKLSLLLLVCFSGTVLANQQASWQRIDISKKASLRGSAVSQNSLWVSGSDNTVFVSQNGGETWLDRSVPLSSKDEKTTDFRDIALFDENTAIVMGAGEDNKSVLYKTSDAGKTWQLLNQNTDAKGFYDSIAFWNEQKGLLLGDPVDGFYVIKKTENGGKNWRRITQMKLPTILTDEAAFAASGNTLITGEEGQAWLTTGGFSASVYYSADFGESWQRQAVPIFQKTSTAGGYGLALNRKQQVFVLGGDYQQRVGHYSNIATYVAKQWQQVDAKERGLRTAMSCIDATCITTGKTSSDISHDDGKTWREFDDKTAGEGNRGFYTLASGKDIFLAAGSKGKVAIYRTK
jgi:photosystem II stability/assembly factor-like uncharacterized protein